MFKSYTKIYHLLINAGNFEQKLLTGFLSSQLVRAEGFETAKEVALMKSLGIDLFQGYYFGKPEPQPKLLTPVRLDQHLINEICAV